MPQLVWPIVIVLSATVLALIVRTMLLGAVERWARPGSALSALAEAIRLPSLLWSVVLGLWIVLEISDLPRRFAHPLSLGLQAAVIVSVTMTAAGLIST